MALSSPHPDERPAPLWTAPERLYLTRDGRAVPDGDPDVHMLLVPAGGSLPLADALRYGLVPLPEPDAAPVASEPEAAPTPEPETAPTSDPVPDAAASDAGTPEA